MLHNQCVITARLALCHYQRLGLRFNTWFQITESKAVSVLYYGNLNSLFAPKITYFIYTQYGPSVSFNERCGVVLIHFKL